MLHSRLSIQRGIQLLRLSPSDAFPLEVEYVGHSCLQFCIYSDSVDQMCRWPSLCLTTLRAPLGCHCNGLFIGITFHPFPATYLSVLESSEVLAFVNVLLTSSCMSSRSIAGATVPTTFWRFLHCSSSVRCYWLEVFKSNACKDRCMSLKRLCRVPSCSQSLQMRVPIAFITSCSLVHVQFKVALSFSMRLSTSCSGPHPRMSSMEGRLSFSQRTSNLKTHPPRY